MTGVQEETADVVLPGPSATGSALSASVPPPTTGGEKNESEDSADETDPLGFSFSLVQPFVSAVKQAIGWEEVEEPPKKSRSYFPFLKKRLSFFPLMEEVKDLIMDEWKKDREAFFLEPFA